MNKEKLRELYNKYNLDKEDFFKHQHYTIITRQGIQNGHFISRASRILRWDEDNCRPQCYACNCHRYGQQYIFAQNLNKEFGYDKAAELLQKSRQLIKQADFELIELIDHYKSLVDSFRN